MRKGSWTWNAKEKENTWTLCYIYEAWLKPTYGYGCVWGLDGNIKSDTWAEIQPINHFEYPVYVSGKIEEFERGGLSEGRKQYAIPKGAKWRKA